MPVLLDALLDIGYNLLYCLLTGCLVEHGSSKAVVLGVIPVPGDMGATTGGLHVDEVHMQGGRNKATEHLS